MYLAYDLALYPGKLQLAHSLTRTHWLMTHEVELQGNCEHAPQQSGSLSETLGGVLFIKNWVH